MDLQREYAPKMMKINKKKNKNKSKRENIYLSIYSRGEKSDTHSIVCSICNVARRPLFRCVATTKDFFPGDRCTLICNLYIGTYSKCAGETLDELFVCLFVFLDRRCFDERAARFSWAVQPILSGGRSLRAHGRRLVGAALILRGTA